MTKKTKEKYTFEEFFLALCAGNLWMLVNKGTQWECLSHQDADLLYAADVYLLYTSDEVVCISEEKPAIPITGGTLVYAYDHPEHKGRWEDYGVVGVYVGECNSSTNPHLVRTSDAMGGLVTFGWAYVDGIEIKEL